MSLPYSSSLWDTQQLRNARAELSFARIRVTQMRHGMDAAREARDTGRLRVLAHEIANALRRQNEAESEVLRMRIPYIEARIEELETLVGELDSYETALDVMRGDLLDSRTRFEELQKLNTIPPAPAGR